jgi:cysteine desulfurase
MISKTLIYLDHAAGTPTSNEVLDSMLPYFGADYGNPSALYSLGRKARYVVEKSRGAVASILQALPDEIIFTGSGTESNNLALIGTARANKIHGNHVLVSAIEHKSVLEATQQLTKEGFIVESVPVDVFGMIDVNDCVRRVNKNTILISVMYANNEIGTIQPIKELSRALSVKRKGGMYPIFHTDACQAAGYLSLNVKDLGVDLLTLNGSKIYGPKGVGVLYRKKSVAMWSIIFGGGQEEGLRSGTESLPNIVGFQEALSRVERQKEKEAVRIAILRDECLKSLRGVLPFLVLNGHPKERLPNNIHISIPDIEGESVVLMLDSLGIAVATGSACSSKDLKVSHVLQAINQEPLLMHGSLRITLGETTTKTQNQISTPSGKLSPTRIPIAPANAIPLAPRPTQTTLVVQGVPPGGMPPWLVWMGAVCLLGGYISIRVGRYSQE